MWCDILNKPEQGSVFREFKGNLMNIPKGYDDEAKSLSTHPLLLPTEDGPHTVSAADKAVLKKDKQEDLFLSQNLSFAQQKLLQTPVCGI